MKRDIAGFTLFEILIVLVIVTVLSALGIVLINPKTQIEKTWDVRRKTDLNLIEKKFEDFYNDNESYPNELACVDEPVQNGNTCSCHICGFKKAGIISYLNTQNCDPEYPRKTYLYTYDCSSEQPQWFELCVALRFPINNDKPVESSYNYGISSPNKKFSYCFSNCPSDEEGNKYCIKDSGGAGICNICGTYAECVLNNRCNYPIVLYRNPDCTNGCTSVNE